jgi:hypothetical protein
MAKIIGIENYEYHIIDDKTGTSRDFTGFKVYVATTMLSSQGRGQKVSEYPVALADVQQVFGCSVPDLDKFLDKDMIYETVPQGKKHLLCRVQLIK